MGKETMLRPIGENDINAAAELTERLFKRPRGRSYPLLSGAGEIAEEYRFRAADANSSLLGYYEGDGRLAGVLALFYFPGEGYLQSTAFVAEEGCAAFEAFLLHLKENFAGYEANVGVAKENERAICALTSFGFALGEASADMRLGRARFAPSTGEFFPVERVRRETFDEYAAFHDAHFPDVFWNARRLGEELGNWRIFAVREGGKIAGGIFISVYGNMAEIFGMAAGRDGRRAETLLSGALAAVLEENESIAEVAYFEDEGARANLCAAIACGFSIRGGYRLYAKRL